MIFQISKIINIIHHTNETSQELSIVMVIYKLQR